MKIKYFFLIFVAIGTLLLLSGFFIAFIHSTFDRKIAKTTGYVVEMSRSPNGRRFAPVVEYRTPDGVTRRYKYRKHSTTPAFKMNEAVLVYFDPEKPDDRVLISVLWGEWVERLIFGGMGGVFSVFGWGGYYVFWRREKKRMALRVSGQPILANKMGVEKKRTYRVNGRYPYVIRAKWRDPQTQEVHVFESDPIWFDPSPFINTKKIKVMIDPHDARKYWMDTTFLPEMA
jgi:hypothetical protein